MWNYLFLLPQRSRDGSIICGPHRPPGHTDSIKMPVSVCPVELSLNFGPASTVSSIILRVGHRTSPVVSPWFALTRFILKNKGTTHAFLNRKLISVFSFHFFPLSQSIILGTEVGCISPIGGQWRDNLPSRYKWCWDQERLGELALGSIKGSKLHIRKANSCLRW